AARNWNTAPSGIVRHTPACSCTVDSYPPSRRHIHPAPPTTYQISWTVACDTAFATWPGASEKWAKLPAPVSRQRGRTVEPSGAGPAGASSPDLVSGRSFMNDSSHPVAGIDASRSTTPRSSAGERLTELVQPGPDGGWRVVAGTAPPPRP